MNIADHKWRQCTRSSKGNRWVLHQEWDCHCDQRRLDSYWNYNVTELLAVNACIATSVNWLKKLFGESTWKLNCNLNSKTEFSVVDNSSLIKREEKI